MYIILDIDQTIADNSHREHHLQQQPKNWDAFFEPSLVMKDTVIPGVQRVLNHLLEHRHTLVFLTGRNESLRDTTMRWLLENLAISVPDEHLLMRPNGNMLSAAEFKREYLQTFRRDLENTTETFLIIEDDLRVANAVRDMGIVLQAPACWDILFPEKSEEM